MLLPTSQQQHHRGFTLLELLIAVTIVSILAAIALPAYMEQARKARRADAQTVLFNDAQALERNHTRVGCYHKTTAADCVANSGTAFAIPFTQAPIDSSERYYQIALTTATTNTFVLTATPENAQAGDKCGNLGLTHTGAKSCSAIADTDECLDVCWRR